MASSSVLSPRPGFGPVDFGLVSFGSARFNQAVFVPTLAARAGFARLSLAAGCLLLSACANGPLAVNVPSAAVSHQQVCTQLAAQLPERVEGQPRRPHQPDSPLTAVWGDPPLVLRCGVPAPAQYSPTAQVVSVNGVDWLPVPQPSGSTHSYVFTTTGRVTNVEVMVPAVYAPEVNPLVDLASAVRAAVPLRPL